MVFVTEIDLPFIQEFPWGEDYSKSYHAAGCQR